MLLHTTKQLNTGSELITDSWELKDLADLNYQAAELAARKTSFFSAVEYLQIGLDLLGENGWVEQYDRTLRFHIDLARMQYSCGLLEDCWKTSGSFDRLQWQGTLNPSPVLNLPVFGSFTEAVVENGKSFEDTEQIYRTRVLCLLQNDLLSDALSKCNPSVVSLTVYLYDKHLILLFVSCRSRGIGHDWRTSTQEVHNGAYIARSHEGSIIFETNS